MDLATLIGLIGGFITVGAAIAIGGTPGAFFDIKALLIVCVGTMLVTLIKFSLGQFLSATSVAVKAFSIRLQTAQELIDKAVELANEARANGLLALEKAELPDEFFRKSINMLVDGHDPDVVKSVLQKDMALTLTRHKDGQSIFKAIGDVAPAMGMIGTLIGLVQMLGSMDDPRQIGPAMAVALLTTLYGAVIANMVALPIAHKLELRSAEERMTKSLIIDAVVAIQDGQNPLVIKDMLRNYLPKSARADESADE